MRQTEPPLRDRDRPKPGAATDVSADRVFRPKAGAPQIGRRRGLVDPRNFILATRDSGYRSTAFVVAEFVDNAIQAGATRVDVSVLRAQDSAYPIELLVVDDGEGMNAAELAQSLTFGGSTRFNDRSAMGRFGMGLPNGGLSTARRVEMYSWRGDTCLTTSLDIDELLSKTRQGPGPVRRVDRPAFAGAGNGTAVLLRRCDRLEYRRSSSLRVRLRTELGRIYRTFITRGLELSIEGESVAPVDPLHLENRHGDGTARAFGDELAYELSGPGGEGRVTVRFSALPVVDWHGLSADEKRRRGITQGPSVSVLRAGREVASGWFFMGTKRRENYDDWWRCEIDFDPELDELFGITHAKQSITPTALLRETLERDLEPIARALNSLVRREFERVKVSQQLNEAELQATRGDARLPPRRRRGGGDGDKHLRELASQFLLGSPDPRCRYRIAISDMSGDAAFHVVTHGDTLVVLLNGRHPLARDLYEPLALSESPSERRTAKLVALLVLAAARAEVGLETRQSREHAAFRHAWSDVISTFFAA